MYYIIHTLIIDIISQADLDPGLLGPGTWDPFPRAWGPVTRRLTHTHVYVVLRF